MGSGETVGLGDLYAAWQDLDPITTTYISYTTGWGADGEWEVTHFTGRYTTGWGTDGEWEVTHFTGTSNIFLVYLGGFAFYSERLAVRALSEPKPTTQ